MARTGRAGHFGTFGPKARDYAQQTGFWAGTETDPNRSIQGFGAHRLTLASGLGDVQFLVADMPTDRRDAADRANDAVLANDYRRGYGADLGTKFENATGVSLPGPLHPRPLGCSKARQDDTDATLTGLIGDALDVSRAALLHAARRKFTYSADLHSKGNQRLSIAAEKILAYSPEAPPVWTSLLEMDVNVAIDGLPATSIGMEIDALELLRTNIYQIMGASNTPQVIAKLVDVAGLWLRALISSHYWSFRGATYGCEFNVPCKGELLSAPRAEQIHCAEEAIEIETIPFTVLRTDDPIGLDADTKVRHSLDLRLTRFSSTEIGDHHTDRLPPILLIHGLAHGGEVFTTQTIDTNLVEFLLRRRSVVWVLDHRLSNNLGDTCKQPGNLDDIAKHDIPAAIRQIIEKDHPPKLDIFAHCVGAAAFSMSVLGGFVRGVTDGTPTQIGSVILHAIHPWVVPSKWNRVSAALASIYQNLLNEETITPIPPTASQLQDQIIDRIGASIEWNDDADTRHHDLERQTETGQLICNRLTVFYGREWVHENVDERTLANLHRLFGPAHLDMLRHVFYMCKRQRLTSATGDDIYVKDDSIDKNWTFPTMFATGLRNQVFDPRSAAVSTSIMTIMFKRFDDPDLRKRTGLDWRRPVCIYLPPDVGHMDFVFGRNAARHVSSEHPGSGIFDELDSFYADPFAYPNRIWSSCEPALRMRSLKRHHWPGRSLPTT